MKLILCILPLIAAPALCLQYDDYIRLDPTIMDRAESEFHQGGDEPFVPPSKEEIEKLMKDISESPAMKKMIDRMRQEKNAGASRQQLIDVAFDMAIEANSGH